MSAANITEASMTQHVPLDSKLLTNAEISDQQTIISFLQKPVRLAASAFTVTDTVQGFVGFNLPLAMTSLEPYASKLKGYLGMRADIVLRLVVNANGFQAGRYIMAFVPVVGAGTDAVLTATGSNFANLTTITQCPHVEIDLSTETQAILGVPYVAITSHLPIVPSNLALFGLLGQARLFAYSPLRSVAGSTTVPYDIYAHFENIELAAPCVPQSGKFIPPPRNNNITKEQDSQSAGPIQGSLRKVTKVANLIGQGIPSLSLLAQPVAWATNLAADIAAVFGWSKPVNLEKNTRVNWLINPFMSNCDTVDNSMPISLFAQNQVEIMPGFAGNDVDEMSIDHLKTIPAYINTIDWTTSNVIGDQLLTINLRPELLQTTFASGSETIACFTPVAFLTQFFSQWRGGIRLTFKIVKTEFHSGRLAIAFNPHQPYQVSAPISLANQPYVHREIIDIRDGTSFDFIVPYTSLTPYKMVGESYGNVSVTVINPLIAPATVSSTISLLVEASAAPDFEYAVPNQPNSAVPVTVFNPQSNKFVPTTDVNSIRTSVIGGSDIVHDDDISSRACVGEKVKSILSLMKKFTLSYRNNTAYAELTPFALKRAGTGPGNASYRDYTDYIDIFSSLYAIGRGGVRYKTIPRFAITATNTASVAIRNPGATDLFPALSSAVIPSGMTNANQQIYSNHGCAGFEYQIPQYDNCYGRALLECSSDFVNPSYNTASITVPRLTVFLSTPQATGANYYHHYRAAADDFQLGYFVGVPPMLMGTNAQF